MTLVRKLLPHQHDINVVLANLPYPWAKQLAALVLGRLGEASARVEGAAKARAARTEKIERVIEQACKGLPKSLHDRAAFYMIKRRLTNTPQNYGATSCPGDRKIREVLRRYRSKCGQ